MRDRKNYPGIDGFRMAAALLVIAIHTSPLASFDETADFVLTRVIARLAVPFFLMTSGFFAVSRYDRHGRRLLTFVKRTALIYGMAMLLYLPVNLYNDYFAMDNLLPSILKDIVFDGTMYHLWYLPASMLGAAIAWGLVRRFHGWTALGISAALYLIGLLGDSWYGLAAQVPLLKGLYDLLFQLFDYTRNGLFFAPVFFVLGSLMADNHWKMENRYCVGGLGVYLGLMLAEALILRRFDLQRHDSMYLSLPLCMVFLFQLLLRIRGKRLAQMRTWSLLIYIVHPVMIVLLRMAAKILHMWAWLVDNSAIHFLAVCLMSVGFGAAAAALWRIYMPKANGRGAGKDRAYLEINLRSLEHNARTLQAAMPPECALMAVVKANAYGHGALEAAAHLDRMGVQAFAVATIDEGIELRRCGIRGEILILGYTDVDRVRELKRHHLIQTLVSAEYARALNSKGVAVRAHVKIDTGMHRLGVADGALGEVREMFALRNIDVCGIYTHLCCADSRGMEDVAFTRGQIDRFYRLLDALKETGVRIPKVHIQSSYGLLNYPELRCDYVRAGIALYGVPSQPGDETVLRLDLRPVLSLKSRVVLLRPVRKGESIGYGRSFVAQRDMKIAILPIGYADGYPRNLSNGKGAAWIRGRRAPVVGRICMDQLAVDVTDIEEIVVEDGAVLMDARECGGISAPDVARSAGSISNELLCRMGARLPVISR